jgi:HSP20 family protein
MTTLTGWDPWRDRFTLPREMTHLLNEVSTGTGARGIAPAVFLALVIRQTATELALEASIPGFSLEEIEVVSEHGVLTIRGERKVEPQPEGCYLRRERRQLSFCRQFALPQEVREREITASFVNGVLSIRVPRVEAPAATRIKVEVGSTAPAPELAPAATSQG